MESNDYDTLIRLLEDAIRIVKKVQAEADPAQQPWKDFTIDLGGPVRKNDILEARREALGNVC